MNAFGNALGYCSRFGIECHGVDIDGAIDCCQKAQSFTVRRPEGAGLARPGAVTDGGVAAVNIPARCQVMGGAISLADRHNPDMLIGDAPNLLKLLMPLIGNKQAIGRPGEALLGAKRRGDFISFAFAGRGKQENLRCVREQVGVFGSVTHCRDLCTVRRPARRTTVPVIRRDGGDSSRLDIKQVDAPLCRRHKTNTLFAIMEACKLAGWAGQILLFALVGCRFGPFRISRTEAEGDLRTIR